MKYWYATFSGSVWVRAESKDDAEHEAWAAINERARDVVELDSVEEGPDMGEEKP